MENKYLESNKIITSSLFIMSITTIGFVLNYAQPIMVPFVLALLIRILIDPIIDFQVIKLQIHRIVAVFISIFLIVFYLL